MASPFIICDSRQERRQQQLSFCPQAKFYLIPPVSELSDAERNSLWYSWNELEGLSDDTKRAVKQLRKCVGGDLRGHQSLPPRHGGKLDRDSNCKEEDDECCPRGLEHLRSSAHMEQRRINRDCALSAVFHEQNRQRESGRWRDEEELRRASRCGSAWARKLASRAGRKDAREARRLLLEDLKAITVDVVEERLISSISVAEEAEEEASRLELLRRAIDLLHTDDSNGTAAEAAVAQRRRNGGRNAANPIGKGRLSQATGETEGRQLWSMSSPPPSLLSHGDE